jgi:hypothetical protein
MSAAVDRLGDHKIRKSWEATGIMRAVCNEVPSAPIAVDSVTKRMVGEYECTHPAYRVCTQCEVWCVCVCVCVCADCWGDHTTVSDPTLQTDPALFR